MPHPALIRGISFSPYHKSQTKELTELHRTEALPRPRVRGGVQDVKKVSLGSRAQSQSNGLAHL